MMSSNLEIWKSLRKMKMKKKLENKNSSDLKSQLKIIKKFMLRVTYIM